MITELLWLVPYLTDAGNLIFFFAGLPQLWKTWKNRKNMEASKGLSNLMLIGYLVAFFFFGTMGLILGGYATLILNIINIIFFSMQLYWKRRRKKK